MNPLKVIGKRARARRINRLLSELGGYEVAMRDRCSQLLELSDREDDLAGEVRRLLRALDGEA